MTAQRTRKAPLVVTLEELYPAFGAVRDRLAAALRGAGFHVQDPDAVYPCVLCVAWARGELAVAVEVTPIKSPGGRKDIDYRADSFRVAVRENGILCDGWTTIPTGGEFGTDHPRVVKIAAVVAKALEAQKHQAAYEANAPKFPWYLTLPAPKRLRAK